MPAVDVDRMVPELRAAWRRLWRVLLTPETEKTRSRESLATRATTGELVDAETSDRRNHNAADRSGSNE